MADLPIPTTLGELDARWFSALFGTTVTDVSVAGPTGGIAVTSRVARLRLVSEPAESAPTFVVAKVANHGWPDGQALYEREIDFYRRFARGRELPIPRCFHADIDNDSGDFVLILEDLSDIEPGHRLEGLSVVEALAVAEGLADLHRQFWGADVIQTLDVRAVSGDRVAKSVANLEDRLRQIKREGRYEVSDELLARVPHVIAQHPPGMERLSRTPQTLVHCDLHVENFFVAARPTGLRLIIIDWQNPHRGNVAFDVGHIVTSLRPEVSAEQRVEIVGHYHRRMAIESLSLDDLRADVAAAIRLQFVGGANWFATFEAESARDSETMQSHWRRLIASLRLP